MVAEFDPFSGDGADVLESVWEPCINKFQMAPPLIVLCVSQDDDFASVSVMRLAGPGDREVARATQETTFKLPLTVVIVDRNNAVAKAMIETNGALTAIVGCNVEQEKSK